MLKRAGIDTLSSTHETATPTEGKYITVFAKSHH
jgi:hypothetical protein